MVEVARKTSVFVGPDILENFARNQSAKKTVRMAGDALAPTDAPVSMATLDDIAKSTTERVPVSDKLMKILAQTSWKEWFAPSNSVVPPLGQHGAILVKNVPRHWLANNRDF